MKTVINDKYNYKEITPEPGYVLTSWNEKKDDIISYTSSTYMCTPLTYEPTDMREITVAKDKKFKEQQRKAIEERENKR